MDVKNNLRVLMAKKKLNIQDVADKTGLARRTISKLFNEQSTTISFETIYKLCKLLECEPGELLYIDKEQVD